MITKNAGKREDRGPLEREIMRQQADVYRQQLGRGGSVRLTVTGNSMLPFLRSGSEVTVVPATLDAIRVGDVILTWRNERLLCHRVFRKRGAEVQTKGDALLRPDRWVNAPHILGKVLTRGRSRAVNAGVRSQWPEWLIARVSWIMALAYPMLRSATRVLRRCQRTRAAARIPETHGQLLISLLRLPSVDEARQLFAVMNDHDWQTFSRLCDREGVSGIVYRLFLRQDAQWYIPQPVRAVWEQCFLTNVGRSLVFSGELAALITQCETARVPVLLVRGADFSAHAYNEPGIRTMNDIDIVLRRSDWAAGQQALTHCGFIPLEGCPHLWEKDGVLIDVHLDKIGFWRVPGWPFAPDIISAGFWQRSIPWAPGCAWVRRLDPIDSVLAAGAHALEHSFGRLIWLYDIRVVVHAAGPHFDWQDVPERARITGLGVPVFLSLEYLAHHGLIEVPAAVLASLSTECRGWYGSRVRQALAADTRNRISGELLALLSVRGVAAKVRFVRQALLVKADHVPQRTATKDLSVYIRRALRLTVGALRGWLRMLGKRSPCVGGRQ